METTLKALLDRISTPAPSSLALEYAYEPEEEQQEMMEAVVKSMEGLSPSLGGFILRMSDEERNATMSAIEEALISGDDTSTKAVISHIPFAVLVVAAVVADEQARVRFDLEVRGQDGVENLGRDLASTARTVAVLGQFDVHYFLPCDSFL